VIFADSLGGIGASPVAVEIGVEEKMYCIRPPSARGRRSDGGGERSLANVDARRNFTQDGNRRGVRVI
jgi:hypothetical protein